MDTFIKEIFFFGRFMIDIDGKDRTILYQLDLDARQSLTQIGKKVDLKKNVVRYRINHLEKKGIIKRYYTIIDTFKLGYISLRIYFKYQYTTPKLQNEIVDYFVKNHNTYWIASTDGKYNLIVIIWVKDPRNFYTLWDTSLKKFRNYFQETDFSFYFQLFHFHNSFLLDNYNVKDREKCEVIGGGEKINVDELDLKILKTIASHARMPLKVIAEKVNSTVPTVTFRLYKLKKTGIIQGFRTEFDLLKLGYQQYKVDIELKDYSKMDAITNYLKENPHLSYITKTAGHTDLEPTFCVRELPHLVEIMDDLNRKFPNSLKNYNFFYIMKIHKLDYMPVFF